MAATKTKKTKKRTAKKKPEPAPAFPQNVVDYIGVDEADINPSVLATAHQKLWGANWRTPKEDAVLAEIQGLRGQRRP